MVETKASKNPNPHKSKSKSSSVKRYHNGFAKNKKSVRENKEIDVLTKRIKECAPEAGANPLNFQPPVDGWGFVGCKEFEDMPVSGLTKEGLRGSNFVSMTAIQRAALPHALAGRDILGAAKTGSGKTLAFLIPVVELLYRLKWGKLDGLGALIISPTRELALQIFEELKKVGKKHEMSAGLLIGGKNVKEEKATVSQMNILVATPGRLLQHMDETYGFDASNLQVLVLDEADRILDLGFSKTINAILDNLPNTRQTMLFSATQAKKIDDLARLSLTDPEYISVHSEASTMTPEKLQQFYVECKLGDKVTALWSFIRTHLKCKTIVFLSTCKQVRFIFEAFRKLQPGVPLRALHGHMPQKKRIMMFEDFCEAKQMVLFATDIAARGLDFPEVHWVVQADCPEDPEAYVHRVGRTARYVSGGQALLILVPSEREMLKQLEAKKIPVKNLKLKPSKMQCPTAALRALLSKTPDLKIAAQRAMVSYLKSVALQPNKKVFQVSELAVEEIVDSFGLVTIPSSKALKKLLKNAKKGNKKGEDIDDVIRHVFDHENSGKNSEKINDLIPENGDLLTIKRKDVLSGEKSQGDSDLGIGQGGILEGKKKKRIKIKINNLSGNRVVFDEDTGEAVNPLASMVNELKKGKRVAPGGDSEGNEKNVGLDAGEFENAEERFAALASGLRARSKSDREFHKKARKEEEMKKSGEADLDDQMERSDSDLEEIVEEMSDASFDEEAEEKLGGPDDMSDSEPEVDQDKLESILGKIRKKGSKSKMKLENNNTGTESVELPPRKKSKKMVSNKQKSSELAGMKIEEQEALALRLLSKQ